MKNLKITFHETVMEDYGTYKLGRSISDKLTVEVSYNTDNYKRAMAFANAKVERMKRANHSLIGLNTTIEFV